MNGICEFNNVRPFPEQPRSKGTALRTRYFPFAPGPNIPLVAKIAVAVLASAALILALFRTPQSPVEELAQIRQMAQQGDDGAQLQLGLAYLKGRDGLAVDTAKGLYWLEQSAKGGQAFAANLLGKVYAEGQGVPVNPALAVSWWQQAAKNGSVDAQVSLGKAYRGGLGAPKDPELARYWLDKAADRGNPEARQLLLDMHRDGEASQKDIEHGMNLFAVAAHRAAPWAGKELAFLSRLEQGLTFVLPRSAERLEALAGKGDPEAQLQLAWRYRTGAWGVSQDDAKALLWFNRAAENGNQQAMHALAEIYREGLLGVSPDPERAAFWQQREQQAALNG